MKQDLSEFKDEVRGTLMVSVLCVLCQETYATDTKECEGVLTL